MEVKSRKGRQSDNQKSFEALVRAKGGYYFLVRSIKDAEESLGFIREQLKSQKGQPFLASSV